MQADIQSQNAFLRFLSSLAFSRMGVTTEKEWEKRTELFMAFLGIWSLPAIVVFFDNQGVPSGDEFGFRIFWVAIIFIFAIDYLVRMSYSQYAGKFVRKNPILVLSFIFPPFRFLLSFGLVRRLFKRGGFKEFAIIAISFMVMGAFLVYYYEHTEAGAFILTRFDAFWWAIVTFTTVGYGDEVPITNEGRGIAIGLIIVGLSLYATLTARIAQNFILSREDLEGINQRLERIENLLNKDRNKE